MAKNLAKWDVTATQQRQAHEKWMTGPVHIENVDQGDIDMHRAHVAFLVLALAGAHPALGLAAASAAQSYSFELFSAPDGECALPSAINDKGQIVGVYDPAPPGGVKGFLLYRGEWTIIEPGPVTVGFGTAVEDINNRGVMIGVSSSFEFGGSFVLDRSGARPLPAVPVADASRASLLGINDSGTIVGTYRTGEEEDPEGFGVVHSFFYRGGAFGTVRDANGDEVFPYRINNRGDFLAYRDLSPFVELEQLLCRKGRCEPFALPLAGVHDIRAVDLNDRGDVVGSYRDETGRAHGFLLRDGYVRTIDAADVGDTFPSGVNNRGWVVGSSIGAPECGFLAIPRESRRETD